MKSIKEKAEECSLVREYVDSCGNFVRENSRVKQEQFTLGANYVLEQIEQLICEKHVGGNLPLFDLTHLIDKLKEK